MRHQSMLYLCALSLALGATSNILADDPTFTTIDFPGATTTTPWTLNTNGDIAGLYVSADKVTHGFVLSGGQYTKVDFPGATGTELYGINPAGDVVGVYTLDGVRNGSQVKGGHASCAGRLAGLRESQLFGQTSDL